MAGRLSIELFFHSGRGELLLPLLLWFPTGARVASIGKIGNDMVLVCVTSQATGRFL